MRLMQARGLPGEMVRIRVLRDVSTSPSEFEPPCSPPSPCHRDTRSPGTLMAIGCGVSPKSEFRERCVDRLSTSSCEKATRLLTFLKFRKETAGNSKAFPN